MLFISAGDRSGDNATARLITELKAIKPEIALFGLGGPRLAALGQEQFVPAERLAVIGFWEVAKQFCFFRRLMHRCVDEITRRQPSAILLVDYPGFNLRLAKRVKHLGIPIIYYISPQLWAWGKARLAQMRELVDHLMIILPFEREFFGPTGIAHSFVGHYLLEDIPAEYVASPLPNRRRLALLPGSRPQEVERMLAPMLDAARIMHERHGYTSEVAAVRGTYDYEGHLRAGDGDFVRLVHDNARRVVFESDLVLTASGTATLEAGIIGRPMVIVYRTGFVTYQIAKRLVTLDSIGLVNLVLSRKFVPELIQGEVTGERMAEALEQYLADEPYRRGVIEALHRLPGILGGGGASRRAAERVASYI